MSTLLRVTAHDLRLQWRHGIVGAVGLVTVMWVVALRLAPVDDRATLLPLVLYTDAGVIGLTFVGGQVLIERRDRVLAALGTSPLRPATYVGGKLASLTGLAAAASALVVVAAGGAPTAAGALVVPPVVLLSLLCLSVGLLVAAHVENVTHFLVLVQLSLVPVLLPILALTGWLPWAVADPVPTAGPLRLLAAVLDGRAPSVGAWSGMVWAAVAGVLLARAASQAVGDRLWRITPASGARTRRDGRQPATAPATATAHVRRPRGPASALVTGDLRRAGRDPIIVLLLAGPVLMALVVRGAVPLLTRAAAARLGWDLTVHYPTMLALLLIVAPLLLGAVAGLLLVEDREEGMLRAVLVTPVARGVVLGRRAVLAAVASAVALTVAVPVSGLTATGGYTVAGVAAAVAVAALLAPVFALLLPAVARNRLESMAVMKVLPLPVFVPLLAPYIDGPANLALGVVPTWWLVAAVQSADEGRVGGLPALGGAVLLVGLSLLAYRTLDRRLRAAQ